MRKFFLMLTMSIAFLGNAFAQKTVSGIVTSATDGLGLPGVNISLKNDNSVGTSTDIDGNFSLNVPNDNSIIVFSAIGMKTIELPATKATKVVMREDTQVLGEVVVTALGIKRQEKALSYNVQQVKQDELTAVKDANFVNSLNGKVAGVNIQRGAAGVGGATKVIMRGAKSLTGNNNVLYVVDGVPIFNKSNASSGGAYEAAGGGGGEGIADFNPEDIESISVLTGPSAAALYGYAAANGVILINTKKGKEGKLSLNASSSTEFLAPFISPKFQSRYGHLNGEETSWGTKLPSSYSFDPMDFFQTGYASTNSVSASTGTKTNQTFFSVASTNAEGIVPSNGYYRYNFTARNTADFLDNRMHADFSASYIMQGHQNMFSQGGYGNPLLPLYLFPRGDNFEDIKAYERYNPARNISEQYWPYGGKISNFTSENPYWIINREIRTSNKERYMFFASLKYDITDWINIAGRIRKDNTTATSETKLYASTTQTIAPGTKGNYSKKVAEDKQTYADVMLNINKDLNDFHLNANIGTSYDNQKQIGTSIGGRLKLIPNLFSAPNFIQNQQGAGQSINETKNIAIFASAELGYKNMAFLTVTGRNDWNSTQVNSQEPSFFYPSVGLSGVLSQMLNLPEFVNYLKVRSSYTEVGSPINKTGLTPGTITYPIKGGNLTPLSTFPFPNFKAERTRSWELGLNTRLFNSKFNMDLTLYKSNTYNQLFYKKLQSSSAYSGFYMQAGNVENKGIELGLGFHDTYFSDSSDELQFSSNVTFTRNVNKIVQLVRNFKNPITGENINMSKLDDNIREGGSMGDITGRGILSRDNNGNLIPNKDGSRYEVDRSQLLLLGNSSPDFTIGFRNNLNYRNFNLGFLINGRFGGIVQSQTQSFLNTYGVSEESAKARDNGGVLVNGKRYDARKYYESIHGLGTYYTYDATNIRLQELNLGYTIKGKYLGNVVKNLTVSFVGRNLFMFYNTAPYDPEVAGNTKSYKQATEFFMIPSLRSLGFSIKAKF